MTPPRDSRRPRSTVQTRVIDRLECALERLQESERSPRTLRVRAESVLSSLADVRCAILIANDAGQYVHANERAARLTGYTQTELRRKSVWDLTPGVREAMARRLWREFLRGGRMRGPYLIQRKNGRPVKVDYVAIAHVLPGVHVSAFLASGR